MRRGPGIALGVTLAVHAMVGGLVLLAVQVQLEKLPLPAVTTSVALWSAATDPPRSAPAIAEAAATPHVVVPELEPPAQARRRAVTVPATPAMATTPTVEIDESNGDADTGAAAMAPVVSPLGLGDGVAIGMRVQRPPPPPPLAITPPRPKGRYDHLRIPYPPLALERRITGVIVVDLWLDATGDVISVDLVRGVGHGLDEAALALAGSFEFEPARDGRGQPMAARVRWQFQVAPPDRVDL